jgi:hypothetical protein
MFAEAEQTTEKENTMPLITINILKYQRFDIFI